VGTFSEQVSATMEGGGYVMPDEALARPAAVRSGDSIKLGTMDFVVAGVVQEIPGGGGILSTSTPSVYISYAALEKTGLMQFGSRVNYSLYLKGDDPTRIASAVEVFRTRAWRLGHGIDDYADNKDDPV